MTPETPAQPPAAPENDMSASERFFAEHWFHDGGDLCECGYWAHLDSVKRHHLEDVLLADLEAAQERLRVVEGERDAARERVEYVVQLNTEKARHVRQLMARLAEVAEVAEERGNEVQAQKDRAESAEAAHEALRKVLDEYFDFDVDPWDDHDAACPAPEDLWRLHRDLRALLAGGAS